MSATQGDSQLVRSSEGETSGSGTLTPEPGIELATDRLPANPAYLLLPPSPPGTPAQLGPRAPPDGH